jgi:porphobilinogen synthase
MQYPQLRLRRLRKNAAIRDMVRETHLTMNDLVMPMFVRPGKGIKNEIPSMPGNYQFSVDTLTARCEELFKQGVKISFIIWYSRT